MLMIPPGLTFFPLISTKQVCSADLVWNSWGGLSVHEPRTDPFEFLPMEMCSTASTPLQLLLHSPLCGSRAMPLCLRSDGTMPVVDSEPHHGIQARASRDQRPPLARVACGRVRLALAPESVASRRRGPPETYRAQQQDSMRAHRILQILRSCTERGPY
jgi:hypothetical protein